MTANRSLARKYARALLESGSEELHESRAGALEELGKLWQSHSELSRTMLNPTVKESEKIEVAQGLAGQLIPEDKAFANFLSLLAKNRRMPMLEVLAEEFKKEFDALKNRLHLKVLSASEVTTEEQNEFNQKLKESFGGLATVSWQTDPTLIGGAILRSGDRVIDGSLGGALRRLETRIRM